MTLEYGESDAYEFSYNPTADGHDFPDFRPAEVQTSYIRGEFQKYVFTIRAYKNTGRSLIDVDLFSSEADLLMILNEENIKLKDVPPHETYRLRKMEFNLREENLERGKSNFDHHLEKLK
ncbi:hypothetical protein [Neobacillus dielmonensis]|uniref:hypothetical protein n=1 Tax=Neobacillus dielmonensis TaxID=1347369 RepID=UPI0005A8E044|nr:hypothetical protein [Neobacillus dielmonensis]